MSPQTVTGASTSSTLGSLRKISPPLSANQHSSPCVCRAPTFPKSKAPAPRSTCPRGKSDSSKRQCPAWTGRLWTRIGRPSGVAWRVLGPERARDVRHARAREPSATHILDDPLVRPDDIPILELMLREINLGHIQPLGSVVLVLLFRGDRFERLGLLEGALLGFGGGRGRCSRHGRVGDAQRWGLRWSGHREKASELVVVTTRVGVGAVGGALR